MTISTWPNPFWWGGRLQLFWYGDMILLLRLNQFSSRPWCMATSTTTAGSPQSQQRSSSTQRKNSKQFLGSRLLEAGQPSSTTHNSRPPSSTSTSDTACPNKSISHYDSSATKTMEHATHLTWWRGRWRHVGVRGAQKQIETATLKITQINIVPVASSGLDTRSKFVSSTLVPT